MVDAVVETKASHTETSMVDAVKQIGKRLARYVGDLRTMGLYTLGYGTMVEVLGMDRFGIMASVRAVGEGWSHTIDVNPRNLIDAV